MRIAPPSSQLSGPLRALLSLVLLLAGSGTGFPACSRTITSGDQTGTVGVAFTYQITVSGGNPQSYNATPLPPGLSVTDPTNGVISGTPTAAGTYSVTLSATYNSGGCTTITKVVTFTINVPAFAGFRLPDFTLGAGSPNNPRLMLQMGASGTGTVSDRFDATLEVQVPGTTTWVPYNHFVGINDQTSWITDAPLPVRGSASPSGIPQAFGSSQLTQSPPGVYMKADPRSTRLGIFQIDLNLSTAASRITLSAWPNNDANVPNGFGGNVATAFPGPIEHAPARFGVSTNYWPATFGINGAADARDTATTTYADADGIVRPADAIYANATYTGYGSSTPYNTITYRPIILNRPFRNVAELGYVFRDLPWKTLDFFTDKSADAGLLDIFTINDGPQVLDNTDNVLGMAPPTVTAGTVNLDSIYLDPNNSALAPVGPPVVAGAIWDEISNSTGSGSGAQSAQTITSNIVNAVSATRMQNKAELLTRAGLPTTLLPTASNDNQAVKARREVVARAMGSVSQTRVWNLLIDVVAQSGHFKPNAASLPNDFIVEGEQHYWVHLAIDRFTGQVVDKQIEVVNE
jgi:hypothetical protein